MAVERIGHREEDRGHDGSRKHALPRAAIFVGVSPVRATTTDPRGGRDDGRDQPDADRARQPVERVAARPAGDGGDQQAAQQQHPDRVGQAEGEQAAVVGQRRREGEGGRGDSHQPTAVAAAAARGAPAAYRARDSTANSP